MQVVNARIVAAQEKHDEHCKQLDQEVQERK